MQEIFRNYLHYHIISSKEFVSIEAGCRLTVLIGIYSMDKSIDVEHIILIDPLIVSLLFVYTYTKTAQQPQHQQRGSYG